MNKLFKRVSALFLCFIMLFGTAPLNGIADLDIHFPSFSFNLPDLSSLFTRKASAEDAATSGTCGDNLTWTLSADGTLTISGTGDMTDYTSTSSAPWYSSRASVNKIVIESGATSIGDYAFYYCTILTKVTISDSVTSIGGFAFACCSGLANITIPNSVTSIGNNAFTSCGFTSVFIPESVTSIEANSYNQGIFYGCSSELIVYCESENKQSGWGPYWISSDRLTTFYFLFSAKEEYCFFDALDSSVTSTIIPYGIDCIPKNAFKNFENLVEITIPESVIRIDQYAFYGCTSLTSVTFGENSQLTSIGYEVFGHCTSLTSVSIPDSVTSIGDYAFYGCSCLKTVTVDENNTAFCDIDGILLNKDKTEIILFPSQNGITVYTIPDGVISIGDYSFCGCSCLTSITVPDSVTSMGNSAFSGCSSLVCVEFSDNSKLTSIKDKVFYNCTNIRSISIPDSVTSMGNSAFSGCSSLVCVEFSDNSKLTSIKDKVFYNCTNIRSISIPDSVTSIGNYAFCKCSSIETVNFGENSKLSKLGSSSNLPLDSVSSNIFNGCSKLKSISLPMSVTSIGSRMFYNCTSLTSIMIPDNTTSIESYAFYGCTSLANVVFSDNSKLADIGGCAFIGCTGLTNITIPDSVTSIGFCAFSGCTGLMSMAIPDSVTSIGFCAFLGVCNISYTENMKASGSPWGAKCVNGYAEGYIVYKDDLKQELCACAQNAVGNIVIPDSVTSIGKRAFQNCSGLKSVTVPSSVISIGDNAFYGVTEVKYNGSALGAPWGAKAVNPYVVKGLNYDLYYYDSSKEVLVGCSSKVDTVEVPDDVKLVGTNCFNGCDNIKEIDFGSSEITFNDDAFAGCDNLKTVTSPNTVDGITYSYHYDVPTVSSAKSGDLVFASAVVNGGNGIQFCDRDKDGTIIIDDSIEYIASDAFANCKNIDVSITSTKIRGIGEDAFLNSKNYNDWDKTGVFTIGNYIIKAADNITSYTFGDSIITAADGAFRGCSKLAKVDMKGSGLKHLGRNLFNGCTALSSITMTSKVDSIGSGAFEDTAFIEDSSNTVDGLTYLGNTVINADKNITSCSFRDGTDCIADNAFEYCTQLTSIIIPDNVTSIGSETFSCCINLNSVTIPDSVTSIGFYAFKDCRRLETASIPASVTSIGDFAYWGCLGLKAFDVAEENDTYKSDGGVLYSEDGTKLIQYPAGKTETNDTFEIPSSVNYIDDLSFRRCNNLTKIIRPKSATLGYYNPFEGCGAMFSTRDSEGTESELSTVAYTDDSQTVLKSVSASVTGTFAVPDSVIEIGANAFKDCTGITSVIFGENSNLSSIDENAFYGCTGIESITLPASLTSIGKSAFEDCANLESVSGGSKEVILGDRAFANTKVTSVPDNMKGGEGVNADSVLHVCTFTVITTDPTCTLDGSRTEKCECGKETITIIPATGHTCADPVKENIVEPTCTEKGSHDNVIYCSVCKAEISRETVTDKATGHTPDDAVKENEVAATCTENGSYDSVVYCSVCKVEISRENVTVDPTGHTPADYVIENETSSSCSEAGTYDKVIYCSVCNAELSRDTITKDKDAHTPEAEVKENEIAAACTEDGSYDSVVYCSVCNAEISREKVTVDPTGHTSEDEVKENEIAATCTEDGSYDSVVYCSVCNAEISRKSVTVPALGHKQNTRTENEKSATYTSDASYELVAYCERCGKELGRETKTSANTKLASSVSIVNKKKYDGTTLEYKSSVTFHATYEGEQTDEIRWYVNNEYKATGNTCTVSEITGGITVEARLFRNGNQVTNSTGSGVTDSETIKVKTDFFSKIIAFFKGLFGLLPTYDQK